MTVTSQTNTTLSEIASALAERDHFVIGGHVSPDGDCLGSALGLAWALRQLGKQVTCVLARDERNGGRWCTAWGDRPGVLPEPQSRLHRA